MERNEFVVVRQIYQIAMFDCFGRGDRETPFREPIKNPADQFPFGDRRPTLCGELLKALIKQVEADGPRDEKTVEGKIRF